MRTFIAKVVHLRVSPIEKGEDYYLCNHKPLIDGRWTWDKKVVTCKNCLKNLPCCYMQRRTMKFTDDENDAKQEKAE